VSRGRGRAAGRRQRETGGRPVPGGQGGQHRGTTSRGGALAAGAILVGPGGDPDRRGRKGKVMPVAGVRGCGRDDAPIVGAAAGRQGQTRELVGRLGDRGRSPDAGAGGGDPQRTSPVAWREGGLRGIGVVDRERVPDALGIPVRTASVQRRRRAACSLDGPCDGLDVLFPGLVIEVFDAPFCSCASRVSPGLVSGLSLVSGPCLSWIVVWCRVAPISCSCVLTRRSLSALASPSSIQHPASSTQRQHPIGPTPTLFHRPPGRAAGSSAGIAWHNMTQDKIRGRGLRTWNCVLLKLFGEPWRACQFLAFATCKVVKLTRGRLTS
jgi:hypothetical protein